MVIVERVVNAASRRPLAGRSKTVLTGSDSQAQDTGLLRREATAEFD